MKKSKPSKGADNQILVLGCGTSTGVPLIHCDCRVCRSRNPRNKRLRASIWVRFRGKSFLVDTSTDLREQCLRFKIPRIDAVLYTHPHADHLHGIDELRSFNYAQKGPISVFGNTWTSNDLKTRFGYIFAPKPVEGGGIPQLILNTIDANSKSIEVEGTQIIPIRVEHGSQECVGYRFDSVAYVTDCSYIPASSIDRLKGLETLILDCVRLKPHGTHLHLEKSLELARQIGAKKTYLTHLGHDFEYVEWSRKLPKGIALAFDGLKVRINK